MVPMVTLPFPLGLLAINLTFRLEPVTGIEPAWPAWKAGALPLSYTDISALPAFQQEPREGSRS